MVAVEGKGGLNCINVAVMMIMIIAADISMAPRNSLTFQSQTEKGRSIGK